MSNIKIEHREEYTDGQLTDEKFILHKEDDWDCGNMPVSREELEAIQRYEIPARKEVRN